jgi:hypothetical protein
VQAILIQKITDHISNWGKFWFGLIFLGSIFNAVAVKITYLASTPHINLWAFGIGALIGLIAKFRTVWL